MRFKKGDLVVRKPTSRNSFWLHTMGRHPQGVDGTYLVEHSGIGYFGTEIVWLEGCKESFSVHKFTKVNLKEEDFL